MKKVRWGIIGPGIIAHDFASDVEHTQHASVVSVASRSADRAKSFAEQYNIPTHYGDYEALYQSPDIDAIYIATPHNFHAEQTIKSLQAGKAVLCEKPITINPQELEKVKRIAQDSNLYLAEGMWTYFLPAIKKAQAWVKEGRIGELLHVKADFGYPVPFNTTGRMYNPDLAGGSLLDMGIYVLAIADLFLQEFPKDMQVHAKKASTGVEDDVAIFCKYTNAVASLTTSFRCKLHNWAFIIGSKGYIAIPDFWRAKECFFYEGEKVVEHFIDPRSGLGFEYEIEAVSSDILMGSKQSPIVSHAVSKRLQDLMHMVKSYF